MVLAPDRFVAYTPLFLLLQAGPTDDTCLNEKGEVPIDGRHRDIEFILAKHPNNILNDKVPLCLLDYLQQEGPLFGPTPPRRLNNMLKLCKRCFVHCRTAYCKRLPYCKFPSKNFLLQFALVVNW